MEWMILPFKRYFDFKGRSRRKEYWMYTLFVIIVSIVLGMLDAALGLGGSTTGETQVTGTSAAASGSVSGGLLSNLFSLATVIPGLAVSVRRLHDLDRSGWWVVLPAAPLLLGAVLLGLGVRMTGGDMGGAATAGMVLIGLGIISLLVLFVWFCTAGTPGPNRFGEDPKGTHTNAEEVFG